MGLNTLPLEAFNQNNQNDVPLIKDLFSLQPAKMDKFGELLSEIRRLRTFISEILPNHEVEDSVLSHIYSLATKAVLNSTLELMGVQVTGINTTKLLQQIESLLGYKITSEVTLYSIDSDSLYTVTTDTFEFAQMEFEHGLQAADTQVFEQQILDQITTGNLPCIALLSKGVVHAYTWLNVRLNYLVDKGGMSLSEATAYLNANLSVLSVYADKVQFVTNPDQVTYYVHISPNAVAEMLRQINSQHYTLLFDELVGYGRSFIAVMKHLLQVTNGNPDVVKLVKMLIPSNDILFVEKSDRLDLTRKDAAGNYVYSHAGTALVVDDASERVDETKFDYVFRLVTHDGVLDHSICFNFTPEAPET